LEKVVLPKAQGEQGLKNTFNFSKALTTKNVWRLIQISRLWAQVIKDKYIALDLLEEWEKSLITRESKIP
jgi:hypothetical protein